jgi:predicted dehydrogenase
MLKVAVLGAGHLGKIHIQQWLQIEEVEFCGFYDPDNLQAQQAISQYNVTRYGSLAELIAKVDVVDIVATTSAHFTLAKECIRAGKHIFIEKPLANSLEEAQELLQLVEEAGIKCQVGHVERYNPAFLALKDVNIQPMFIEGHRLAQFTARGTDVSVILDLMIHDIDLVLHLVKSPVKSISASGVAVISETADIANARIEFDNGCVANLTSSRISLKKMRKLRLFQRDAYIGIDFLEKKSEIIQLKNDATVKGIMEIPIELSDGNRKVMSVHLPEVQPVNAIRAELMDFISAITDQRQVQVSAVDGYKAMEVAHQILKKMNTHSELHNL